MPKAMPLAKPTMQARTLIRPKMMKAPKLMVVGFCKIAHAKDAKDAKDAKGGMFMKAGGSHRGGWGG